MQVVGRQNKYFFKNKITLSDKSNISLSLSHFTSKWNASGQVPDRAVSSKAVSELNYTAGTPFAAKVILGINF
jgi:hypothetical protein